MTDLIKKMLAEAYRHLGIADKKENDRLVEAAVHYLTNDREHYIEIAEPDRPEYLTSSEQGVICNIVPLARSVITDKAKTYREVFTTTLYLVVTTETADYVHAYTKEKFYDDPAKNTHTHSFYRYTKLSQLTDSLKPLPPEQIIPIATPRDWEIFRMAFAAYAKFCGSYHINFIPQRAEQAMEHICYTPEETFTVDNREVTGKAIPLVYTQYFQQPLQQDRRISIDQRLYLLLTDGAPRYMLQTSRTCLYLQEVPPGDGSSLFEDTGEQTEITYGFVELEDVRLPMSPY